MKPLLFWFIAVKLLSHHRVYNVIAPTIDYNVYLEQVNDSTIHVTYNISDYNHFVQEQDDFYQVSLRNITFLASCQKQHFSDPSIRPVKITRSSYIFLYLLSIQAGDIQLNPGPPRRKFPCGVCSKAVKHKDKGIGCDQCYVWYHTDCMQMRDIVYENLKSEPDNISWICADCGMPNFASSFFESSLSMSTLESHNNYSCLTQDSPGPPLAASSPKDPTTSKKPHSQVKAKIHPNLTSIVVNCRSIVSNRGPFKNLIESTKPDIVVGTESWLTSEHSNSEYFPDGYSIYRKDRGPHNDKKTGGGVFLMISSKYISVQLSDLDVDCELIWAQVQLPGLKYLNVGAFYRPDYTGEEYLKNLNTSLGRISKKYTAHLAWGGLQPAQHRLGN